MSSVTKTKLILPPRDARYGKFSFVFCNNNKKIIKGIIKRKRKKKKERRQKKMINLFQKKHHMLRPLIISYICLVACIKLFAPDCFVQDENQQCNSEGVDDTVIGWTTDLFIAIWMFIFAYKHYSCHHRGGGQHHRRSQHHQQMTTDAAATKKAIASEATSAASLSQLFMGMVFFFGCFAHIYFPNSG